MFSIRMTVLFLGLTLALIQPVQADPNYTAINTAIAKDVIVSGYDRLANATDAHAQDWTAACTGKGVELDQLKASYHGVADAWAGVFHWNFGPVTFLLRRDRLYHWPERRNAVSKSLRKLMANEDWEKLKLENFSHISVAGQGLPAMERLLFEHKDVLSNAWSCRLGQTISANMAEMAAGTSKEWHEDVLPTIERGEEHPIYFDGPKETLNKLFTELLTGYVIIKDQKMLPVLGSSAKKAKPTLVEARRSARFARNLELNLTTLFAGDAVMAAYLPKDEAAHLSKQRDAVMVMAKALPDLGGAVYDEQGRAQYKAFLDALSALRKDMVTFYTQNLGVVIGFNSLDGD